MNDLLVYRVVMTMFHLYAGTGLPGSQGKPALLHGQVFPFVAGGSSTTPPTRDARSCRPASPSCWDTTPPFRGLLS